MDLQLCCSRFFVLDTATTTAIAAATPIAAAQALLENWPWNGLGFRDVFGLKAGVGGSASLFRTCFT